MYLLDTNTIIYFFKGMGNVANVLFTHPPSKIYIPSVVIYELEVGLLKSTNPAKREDQLSQLISHVNIIDFTEKEAKSSAYIRASLEAIGEPIGPIDTLIAGYAVSNNLTLVTRNLKEFEKVNGLKVENWY
jgi:tRNA(fMet)-specific endonuclease VapC